MTEFLRRHSLLITAFVLLICSLQLMSVSIEHRAFPQFGARLVNSVIAPAQKAHHELFESLRAMWKHYVWLLEVESERNTLIGQVKRLEEENSRLIEFERENERLRQLLAYTEETGHRGVAASVIGANPLNLVRSITIDRGSNDGVASGLPVVDGHAIVGQTTTVLGGSAKVLLLTDNTSAIDAIVQRSRAFGIAEGAGKFLQLRYVLKEYEVKPGDRVIASGIGGVFPKGTLIGVVTSVDASISGLFQRIDVEPKVDLNRLETVLVVLPEQKPQDTEPAGAATKATEAPKEAP